MFIFLLLNGIVILDDQALEGTTIKQVDQERERLERYHHELAEMISARHDKMENLWKRFEVRTLNIINYKSLNYGFLHLFHGDNFLLIFYRFYSCLKKATTSQLSRKFVVQKEDNDVQLSDSIEDNEKPEALLNEQIFQQEDEKKIHEKSEEFQKSGNKLSPSNDGDTKTSETSPQQEQCYTDIGTDDQQINATLPQSNFEKNKIRLTSIDLPVLPETSILNGNDDMMGIMNSLNFQFSS